MVYDCTAHHHNGSGGVVFNLPAPRREGQESQFLGEVGLKVRLSGSRFDK